MVVDGHEIDGFSTYSFSESMLTPACPFSFTHAFDREVWDLCRPDRTVQILIDGVPKLRGLIDERYISEGEEVIHIDGRDRTGRLVQDCAPGVSFAGLGLIDIIEKLAEPWGFECVFTNDANRRVILGRGRKAKGHRRSTKKGKSFQGKIKTLRGHDSALRLNSRVGTQIEPGQTRWQVISTLATQAGYLVWSSGDGRTLIVGEPDYDQDVQFTFFYPRAGSLRLDESSCLGMGIRDSVADRYSRIIVVGAGSGTTANYGAAVSSRYAEVRDTGWVGFDGVDDPEGVGRDFSEPKRLILSRSVQSNSEAQEIADREMSRRDAHGHGLTVRAAGHGQIYDGSTPTLFAPDTLALCEDERTGTAGIYLVTGCSYQSGRDGEETILTLIKSGADLTQI